MKMDEIVNDLMKSVLSEEANIKEFLQVDEADLHQFHHGFGTYIRNTYSLWFENPLTEKWRTDEASRNIVDGVDYSDDHPDAVSMQIIKTLYTKMKETSLGS